MSPKIESFFDETTSTISYVVYEDVGTACAIIDPVLDYDPKSGRTSTGSAARIAAFVREKNLGVQWLLETHAHADHLSAAAYLQSELGGTIAIGQHIRMVQSAFKPIFNFGAEVPDDGSQFDHLFAPDEVFHIGRLQARALHVPGHTPADMAYYVQDEIAFVGDTLFMPDVGTARCDFPGGDARALYRSIRKLLRLPAQTRLFMCHDYAPAGRAPAWETTVAEQAAHNIHARLDISEEDFVSMRTHRDATLGMPTLILPAIQVNVRAGALPDPENNGTRYLKIPLNAL